MEEYITLFWCYWC